MSDSLILKVTTGSDGNIMPSLASMTVQEAEAFLALYKSLLELVEVTGQTDSATISITQGSLSAGAHGDSVVAEMSQYIESTVNRECEDDKILSPLRKIQHVFQLNGMEYDLVVNRGGVITSYYDRFKTSKVFRRKSERIEYKSNIEFLTGHLYTSGGKKKQNIHFETSDGEDIIINCSKDNSELAGHYLHHDIKISVWHQEDSPRRRAYELCDVYLDGYEELFLEFKQFFESLKNQDEYEGLTIIHDKINEYVTHREIDKLCMITRLFAHKSTDIQTLKIISVVTKRLKDVDGYVGFRNEILKYYNIKFKKEMNLLKQARKDRNEA